MVKKFLGAGGGACKPDTDIPKIYTLFKNADTQLDALLTRRYPLDDINEALGDLAAGRVFRPLIVMRHPEEL